MKCPVILTIVRRYGQHLSKEGADALTAPHPDSVRAVEEWLKFHGIGLDVIQRTEAGDWITIRVTVSQAERMLGTKYNVYYHPASSEHVVRTISYSLPRELHAYVDVVAPTTYFGTMRSMRVTSFVEPEIIPQIHDLSSCSKAITPSCLRVLYKTIDYVPQAKSTNQLGVVGYLGEYANRKDLQV